MTEDTHDWPDFSALDSELAASLTFILEAGRLKSVLRQTQLLFPARRENSAEHSWHLILMAVVLRPYANAAVDLEKVVSMLALHDLGEIETGDVFHYHKTEQNGERAAVEKLFACLPAETGQRCLALWDEFETGATMEAKFARALDRFQPFLDNLANGGESWLRNGISLQKALARMHRLRKVRLSCGKLTRYWQRKRSATGCSLPLENKLQIS